MSVFSADAGSDVSSSECDDGVRIRRFRSCSPGDAFYIAPQLVRAIRQAEADIVHAHNYHAVPVLFAALGVSDERFVVTTHYHGGSASPIRDRLLSLYRPIGRWAVKQADDVIAVSEWEREQLRKDFGVEATVIPNGLNVDRFVNAEPEERERPYLLCVGRLEEYKGIQHVIRALPELPQYELVVAGTGPYREVLVQMARTERVADRVEFLDFVDDERLSRLYAGADVYITLSEFEAYGMTVAEALATGTPCVVNANTALEEWTVTQGVVGITDLKSEVIVESVRQAHEQSVLKQPPTWSQTVENLINIYAR